jgi:hypothetical protein
MSSTVELLPEQLNEQATPCTGSAPEHAEDMIPGLTPECAAQPECPFSLEEHDV